MAEAQVGGEPHVDMPPERAAQEFGVQVQSLDDLVDVAGDRCGIDAGTQGLDETGGVFQVGRQPDLGDGDRDPDQGRVADLVLAHHLDEGVADHFGSAQLALADRAGLGGGLFGFAVAHGFVLVACRGSDPALKSEGAGSSPARSLCPIAPARPRP